MNGEEDQPRMLTRAVCWACGRGIGQGLASVGWTYIYGPVLLAMLTSGFGKISSLLRFQGVQIFAGLVRLPRTCLYLERLRSQNACWPPLCAFWHAARSRDCSEELWTMYYRRIVSPASGQVIFLDFDRLR